MTFHKNPSSGIQVVQRGQALQGSLLVPIHFATHLKRKLNYYFISSVSLNNGHLSDVWLTVHRNSVWIRKTD